MIKNSSLLTLLILTLAVLIPSVIENITAGGSTNSEGGLMEAYRLAKSDFRSDGINRVILAPDGDFNVCMADAEDMKEFITRPAGSGIGLTTLGFGMSTYNDEMLEQLADTGNGNHSSIDNLNEAHKVRAQQLTSTLTLKTTRKIQVR
ncbi:MAG: hypothetical protein VB957_16875 [Pseudomonadales bacterium]|jgi:Ca-activated chloride channel family protein